MARIEQNGIPLDFTCENKRFKTDITKGHNGSVTENYLYEEDGEVLSLEYVIDKINGNSIYWFMWYKDGIPKLATSAVMDETAITEVIKNITAIKF